MTVQSSAYHHSNILASQVLLEVKNVQENVLQALEIHTAQIETKAEALTPPLPQDQVVNVTTSDTVQLEMLRVI